MSLLDGVPDVVRYATIPRDEWQATMDVHQAAYKAWELLPENMIEGQYTAISPIEKCENCGVDGVVFVLDWEGRRYLHRILSMRIDTTMRPGNVGFVQTQGTIHNCHGRTGLHNASTSTGESQRGRVSDLLP